ncbi:MAG TPA: thiamine pyrophosphate-dependent enzyme [Candidatus Dormibacteraeota bacterium]|nr:thiamine pyrophosphate-dependent enzyme [Candidatus Dormibacteraeota bacterium]
MTRMTGGEALVQSLYREGIRVVFGLPGVQLYGVMAALRDEPRIRFITTRHEQATSYMADGYARAGGDVGTGLVVPGPGLLNSTAGLSTAYSASSPVLMLSGQIPREQIGKNVGLLHEVNDQQDCIAPITKWRRRVLQVAEIPAAVREAFTQLRTGRPRPVELEMPPETMEEEGDADLLPATEAGRAAAPAPDIARAVEILLAAKNPIMYAGGGANLSGAHEALRAVAEHLQAGVASSPEGKGAVSDLSDLSLGAAFWRDSPLRAAIHAADVALVIGSRLALVTFAPGQRIVQIDVDPEEIGRNHKNTVGLVGDARRTLEALLEKLRAAAAPRPSRKAEREALRAEIAALMTQEPQTSILRSLRSGCPEDTILIAGMTQIGYYSRPFWPTYAPRTYITSSYSGNLGYEYPVALGAKIARPEKPVVAVIGDGGFLFNAQELATAVQHKINVVAVVFNDDAYGNVARDLDEDWGGNFGAALHNPDFMKLADAYGVHGMRAKEPTDVGRLVKEAIGLERPVLIEVPVGRMPRPVFFAARKAPTKYTR